LPSTWARIPPCGQGGDAEFYAEEWMQLPVTIQRILLSTVTIATALTAVDLAISPASISNIVPIIWVWYLVFYMNFVLITLFGIRKGFPLTLRLKILFFGLAILFGVAHLVFRDVFFLGINIEGVFLWCGIGSMLASFVFWIIFLFTGFGRKRQEG